MKPYNLISGYQGGNIYNFEYCNLTFWPIRISVIKVYRLKDKDSNTVTK